MPVAKLSREFYERFGDKLTDELVNCLNSIEGSYRAELRDLFDAHFGRFEEKLERRLMDSKAELGAAKAELGIKIEQLRAEFGTTIERQRAAFGASIEQLRVELHSTKADMLKWSVGLWVPVTLAVIGLYFKR
jgi:hypothetical protein